MENIPEIKKDQLPASIEEIHKFILIGNEVLKAHKAKIRALGKIESSYATKEAALKDGQDVAGILLDAEAKLGELLKAIRPKPKSDCSGKGTFGGRDPSLPSGITKRASHKAQTIASNPEIIDSLCGLLVPFTEPIAGILNRDRNEAPTSKSLERSDCN
jgi:hypothetical protein